MDGHQEREAQTLFNELTNYERKGVGIILDGCLLYTSFLFWFLHILTYQILLLYLKLSGFYSIKH